MVRRLQVAIDCADPERLVTFWATVLGYVIDAPPVRAPLPRPDRRRRRTSDGDRRFRDIYNRIRPHQALDDRTPRQAYLDT